MKRKCIQHLNVEQNIGVNNRNLKNFTIDVRNSLRLRALVPKDVVFVSESGIKTREDTRQLAAYHVNAVLSVRL